MEKRDNMDASRVYRERVTVADDRVELSGDYLLPEQFDDAKRIIRVEGTLRPGGRYVNGGEAEYEGEMVYSVLYLTDSNSIKNAVFKTKYDKCITIPEGVADGGSVYPSFSGVECKLVNPRKMNLRSVIDLNFEGYRTLSAMPVFSGDTPDEDAMSCEKKDERLDYLCAVTLNSQDNRMSRDFELESGEKSVKEIICCTMTVVPGEYTVSRGSVRATAEAHLKVVYLVKNDEDVEYGCASRVFRMDTDLKGDGIREDMEGGIEYYVKEISVSVSKDGDGENRYFEIDFTYDACGRLYGRDSCDFVSDLYSCDFESDITYSDISLLNYLGARNEAARFHCEVDSPHNVALMAPEATVTSIHTKEDGDKLYVDMDVCVTAILRNEDARLSSFSHELPVRITMDKVTADKCEAAATVRELKVELKDDRIEIGGETRVTAALFSRVCCNAVSAVTLRKDTPREEASGLPITFYYPEEGEELWDIAKRYGSTVDVIMSANELRDEKIGKTVLLIPKKRRRPLFSRVITK